MEEVGGWREGGVKYKEESGGREGGVWRERERRFGEKLTRMPVEFSQGEKRGERCLKSFKSPLESSESLESPDAK